jgi:hypothetical protein
MHICVGGATSCQACAVSQNVDCWRLDLLQPAAVAAIMAVFNDDLQVCCPMQELQPLQQASRYRRLSLLGY